MVVSEERGECLEFFLGVQKISKFLGRKSIFPLKKDGQIRRCHVNVVFSNLNLHDRCSFRCVISPSARRFEQVKVSLAWVEFPSFESEDQIVSTPFTVI